MAHAHGRIGTERYPISIRAGGHDLLADEGPALGGGDTGPAPFELLCAALVACTGITLRMYAERKGWTIPAIEVDAHYVKAADAPGRIERTVTLSGPVDPDQRARLADIAERTPVTLALKSGVAIHTTLA